MKTSLWAAVGVLAVSLGWARAESNVAAGAAAARNALGDMHFAAGEAAPEPAPVPPPPDAEPVPDQPQITPLTYDAEPGLSLYRNMKAMDDLAGRTCSGPACLGLFGIQEYYASNFSAGYKATVPLLYTADKMLGDTAHDLAAHLCGHTFSSGDENGTSTIYRMLFTQNEAMSYLKVIESNAGRSGKELVTCVPSELPVNGKSLKQKPDPEPAPAPAKPAKKPKR